MQLLAANHRQRVDDGREKAGLGTKMAAKLEVLPLIKIIYLSM
jgi:hypothetical protein